MSLLNAAKKYTLSLVAVMIGSPLLLFFFQNCGKAGFDSNTNCLEDEAQCAADAASGSTDGTTSVTGDDTPFAFDSTINQITFMSTTNEVNYNPNNVGGHTVSKVVNISDKNTYFTLRMGAYAAITNASTNLTYPSAGIKITQEYLDAVDTIYGMAGVNKRQATAEELYTNLQISSENLKASPVFSLRIVGSERVHMSDDSTGGAYAVPISDLTTPQVAVPLFMNRGQFLNFFALNSWAPEQRVLEGSIYISTRDYLNEFRANAYGSNPQSVLGPLALTYTSNTNGEQDPSVARAPASQASSIVNKAYGRQYRMGFDANDNSGMGNPPLNNIQEYNLLTQQMATDSTGQTVQWDCNAVRRYTVTRYEDGALCLPYTYEQLQNNQIEFEYQVLRRHLPSTSWVIGQMVNPNNSNDVRPCLRPLVGNPYFVYTSNTNGQVAWRPTYFGEGICGPYPNAIGDCPHYVNTCLRR